MSEGDAEKDSLFHLAESGDLEKIKLIIGENQAKIRIPNKIGSTLLHIASWRGHLDCCKYFIRNGGLVDIPNNEGATPLHCAGVGGHKNVSQYLIECGADVHAVDRYGFTPLHYSNRNGHVVNSIFLIDSGADMDALNCRGETPLDISEDFALREAVHREEMKLYSDKVKERSMAAKAVEIYGDTESEVAKMCFGTYTPRYTQCGWPVYVKDGDSSLWLTYFGDDSHGTWRVQRNKMDGRKFETFLKTAVRPACFPQDIGERGEWLQWRGDSAWAILSAKQDFSVCVDVHVRVVAPGI